MLFSLLTLLLFSRAFGFVLPHETYTLSNGMSVILIEDHSIPQVVVDVWYGVGASDDPIGASGFAHLFEHLMFMGTKRIGQGEFDSRMEAHGGWNNASTASDYTNYYSVGPSEMLELFLFLEADRMVGLDITQEKLNLQREVVRNERRQNYEDAPYGAIWLNLSEMMYPPKHPYHLEGIGSHDDLLAATMDTVTQFYSDWYMPNNATLCVSGDFDAEDAKKYIEKYFGSIEAQTPPQQQIVPKIERPHVFEKTIYDMIQIPAVVLTWHSPAYLQAGDAELDVLSSLLAGSENGRLNQKFILDEERVQEFEVFQYSQQDASLFIIIAYTRPDTDIRMLAQDIKTELYAITNDKPLEEKELFLSVKDLEMQWYQHLESNLDRAEQLQSLFYHTGNTRNILQLVERYKTLQVQDVQKAIKTYLDPQKASILYVLPKE